MYATGMTGTRITAQTKAETSQDVVSKTTITTSWPTLNFCPISQFFLLQFLSPI